ncbi:MAG: hypothetical protein DCC68_22715 [Planctomycetota bacterium]|nr:MAG: hypothetical protein DCC68_22715 [Planctomycetota bacterium]
MTSRPPIVEASNVDRRVEAFEERLAAQGSAAIAEFLPPADNPAYDETLVELVRVDLEWSWNRGRRKPVETYLAEFPTLGGSPAAIGQIALEEYRVRRRLGDLVDPSEYARRFGAAIDDWPSVARGSGIAGAANSPPRAAGGGSTGIAHETLGAHAATAELPAVGDRFLDFDLVDDLGRGTFGRVYLARQSGLAGRLVALKVMRIASDESQHLARLQHTHIVPIHSVHRAGTWQAVCMPYFGRTTLADALRKLAHGETDRTAGRNVFFAAAGDTGSHGDSHHTSGHRNEGGKRATYLDAALTIAYELATGLAHAHRRGLVHRDLKPANVLLADDGRAMILDFGLAQTIAPASDAAVTLLGGTLPYMAPEQIAAFAHGGSVGPAADIYALGAILYEMLAGRLPYDAPTGPARLAFDNLAAARKSPPPSLRHFDRNVPHAVDAIVRMCLAFDPERRYATADDLAEDLRRQLASEPLRHAPDRSPRERLGKWAHRHPSLFSSTAIVMVAVLAVASVGGLWIARGQRIARLEAHDEALTLRHHAAEHAIALTSPDLTTAELHAAVADATSAISRFHVLDAAEWRERPPFALLAEEDRSAAAETIAKTLFFAGRALERRAAHGVEDRERAELRRQAAELLAAAQDLAPIGVWPPASAGASRSSAARDDALARLFAGYDLLATKRYEAALPLLHAACTASPQDVSAWFLLGNCQAGLGRLAEAESTFALCASMSPNSYVAYYHRGLCRLQSKRFAEAAQDFDRVLELRPHLYGAHVNRAIALEGQHDDRAAESELTAALADREAETRLYFLRARVRRRLGDRDGAERDRREGLRRAPRDELSWVARGYAQMPSSPERALADFRQALRINPDSLPALRNIAFVLAERLGKNDEALSAMNRIVELAPQDLDARASRGVVAARLGDCDRAIDDARFAGRASPDARTTYKVACIYALATRREEAHAAAALSTLGAALRQDATLHELARGDCDLDAVHDRAEFAELVGAAAVLSKSTGTSEPEPATNPGIRHDE